MGVEYTQTLRDWWGGMAREAGLRHVDGWGDRSLFAGDLPAWERLLAALEAIPERSTSATAARKRVGAVVEQGKREQTRTAGRRR